MIGEELKNGMFRVGVRAFSSKCSSKVGKIIFIFRDAGDMAKETKSVHTLNFLTFSLTLLFIFLFLFVYFNESLWKNTLLLFFFVWKYIIY